MSKGERWLPDNELARPASVLMNRFIQRLDAYPQQLDDGRYVCVHEQLNVERLYAHLRGDITLGTYLLNRDSKVRSIVLDDDSESGWKSLLDYGAKLATDSVPSYLEKSRRGGHLWIFFGKPVDASLARGFVQAFLKKNKIDKIELYPKQDTIGNAFGSLIRLPFGIHRLTGRRYGFFTHRGEPLGSTLREQIDFLQRPDFVSDDVLKSFKVVSPSLLAETPPKRLQGATDHVSERIKLQVTALEFISQYVDLKKTENGGVGLCPFHDDQTPSFGVNDKQNYWHCFAGCGGGSIIDFWSLWRREEGNDSAFIPTITELAEMLL